MRRARRAGRRVILSRRLRGLGRAASIACAAGAATTVLLGRKVRINASTTRRKNPDRPLPRFRSTIRSTSPARRSTITPNSPPASRRSSAGSMAAHCAADFAGLTPLEHTDPPRSRAHAARSTSPRVVAHASMPPLLKRAADSCCVFAIDAGRRPTPTAAPTPRPARTVHAADDVCRRNCRSTVRSSGLPQAR